MHIMNEDLEAINRKLESKSAEEIISWAIQLCKRTITTTTFGDHSAALLHMVTRERADMPIVWVDTGYNTPATYRFSDKLIEDLELNMQIYSPEMTTVRRNVLMGGIPDIDHPLHEEFTRQVKLEPFDRANNALQTMVWITGIRREQTDYRRSLDIVSRTKEGYLKVAPLLNWDEAKLEGYLAKHNLPNEPDYFDPTKVSESRECGLHA
jgi:phosphoadenosine phosphosulfate reductase